MAGVAQQRNMRVKRLRALVTTAAGGLRAQHISQLQQPARRLAHPQPHNARTQPLTGVIQMQRKARLANSSGQLRKRAAYRY